MERTHLIELYRILNDRFNEGELRTLCLYLEIDYDALTGEGKADKARELIAYLDRRRSISQLGEVGRQLRPDISWSDVLEPNANEIMGGSNTHKLADEDKRIRNGDINVSNSPGSIITRNQQGDNIIITPTVGLRPAIKFFGNETQIQRDTNTGIYRASYYFGSEHGLALVNISIRIRFDKAFEDIASSIVGSGMVVAGSLQRQIDSDKKGYLFRTNLLQPANYVRIDVTSREKPEIVLLDTQPS